MSDVPEERFKSKLGEDGSEKQNESDSEEEGKEKAEVVRFDVD